MTKPARCVRRAWLCGFDDYFQRSFEHRKEWVERRIMELVDFTRQIVHPGKRGVIKQTELRALTKLGLDPNH